MNATDELERQLRSMLANAAPWREPDGLVEAVLSESRSVRQRPALFVAVRSGSVARRTRADLRLLPALLVGLLIASLLGGLLLVGAARFLRPAPRTVPGFVPTGSMSSARANATAVRLADGRVLVLGGWLGGADASGHKGVTSAEIYDPKTNAFAATGSMVEGRVSPSATLLDDGRVIVAGGYPFQSMTARSADPLGSAELYDPATGKFRPTAPMAEPRAMHFAGRLPSGDVLFAGGHGAVVNSGQGAQELEPLTLERFDPASATFQSGGVAARLGVSFRPLLLLTDSRLLFVGVDGLALYDPSAGAVQPVAGSDLDVTTATLLRDGRVLTGGPRLGDAREALQLFDPSTGMFGAVAFPAGTVERLIEMGDGRVSVLGWTAVPSAQPGTLNPAATFEVYDPSTGVFTSVPPPPGAPSQGRFTATSLADGSILFAGGAVSPTGMTTPIASAHVLAPNGASR